MWSVGAVEVFQRTFYGPRHPSIVLRVEFQDGFHLEFSRHVYDNSHALCGAGSHGSDVLERGREPKVVAAQLIAFIRIEIDARKLAHRDAHFANFIGGGNLSENRTMVREVCASHDTGDGA